MTIGSIESALGSRRARRAWIYGLGLATGLVAGLVAVAYRALAAALEALRAASFSLGSGAGWPRVLAWLGACALAGSATALMVRKAPLIKGSGIPQVKAELARKLRSDWRKELPLKFAGGSLALGAGLSLGREGPSIQLGSLAGAALAELSGRPETRRYLLTAGAAAGIAAAFNAPLAGVLFCLEELHRCFSPVMLGCSMLAALAADGVSRLLLGDGSVFGFSLAATLPLRLYPLVLALGAACGLLGAGFNAALLGTQSALRRLLPREGARILAVFVAGGIVALLAPRIAGGGHALVEAVAGGGLALSALAALAVGKLLFTL
ncbi:MAG TPA: chloride channel protein, partial [Spirochaetia bacterium]|nr:chloride channel protein [Spirochaetia bacterium]